MYNRTGWRWLERTCSAVGEGKVLFIKIAKPGMFVLSIVPKENFLAYSTQIIFLIIRLVPWSVVMVAIDMCGKSPVTGEWIYGITWKHVLAFIYFKILLLLFFSLFVCMFFIIILIVCLIFNNIFTFLYL